MALKKILKSGNVHLGICGTPTKLYDMNSELLHVGDLVQVSIYTKYQDDLVIGDFYGVAYVVESNVEEVNDNPKQFVMGIASEHYCYLDGEPCESIEDADYVQSVIYQNHDKWTIVKVKDWKATVDGEVWGSVRTVITN